MDNNDLACAAMCLLCCAACPEPESEISQLRRQRVQELEKRVENLEALLQARKQPSMIYVPVSLEGSKQPPSCINVYSTDVGK
jgi:hypothetical protein